MTIYPKKESMDAELRREFPIETARYEISTLQFLLDIRTQERDAALKKLATVEEKLARPHHGQDQGKREAAEYDGDEAGTGDVA